VRSNDKRLKDAAKHIDAADSPRLEPLLHEIADPPNRLVTFSFPAHDGLPKPRMPRPRKAHASKAEPGEARHPRKNQVGDCFPRVPFRAEAIHYFRDWRA
jgi:hypothetical protein